MKNPILAIFAQPFQNLALPPHNHFFLKTAIVTGANSGIGLEAARHLLLGGAGRVILACRNLQAGEAAKENLYATKGVNAAQIIEVWELDMASFASTRAFADRANQLDKIHYVFLNAGLQTLTYKETEDGWETMTQVNGLSTALLALLLLPKLEAQARAGTGAASTIPHLVITSSGLHAVSPFFERNEDNILQTFSSQDNFNKRFKHSEMYIYMTTKLFNVYTVQRLAHMIPNHPQTGHPLVLVSSVDPGFCHTALQREGLNIPLIIIRKLFGRSIEMGSRNLLKAAMITKEEQGRYVADTQVTPSGGFSNTEEGTRGGDKVWAEMIEVLKRVSPAVEATLARH